MATVKKGMLTTSGNWWKHMRRLKRAIWKSERQAGKKTAATEAKPEKGE